MAARAEDDLQAFVPRLAVELERRPIPSHNSVEGSMLSADISGFTALSERLAGKGKAGAEEITELINHCFTALIGASDGYGGEVLKFGGDALLILFRGDRHERRAVDAALAMQAALNASGAARRASLSMTVGVAGGPFDVYLVGSWHHELLVTGSRASEVIRLEGEAAHGGTLASPELATLLPPDMVGEEVAGGHVVFGEPEVPTLNASSVAKAGRLPRHVPASVVMQLEGLAELGGEHRLVTVGFLMVTGVERLALEQGPTGAAAALHQLVDDVVEVCAPFAVTPLHTDIATDGIKFVLASGAPVGRGNVIDAMVEAALAISRIDSPLCLRQGVQTGRVFAGFLGSPRRRTYTLMGDPVNTAARMLGKADDRDVIAVDDVVSSTRTVYDTEPLEPFMVKGKTEPILAHRVLAATSRTRTQAGRSDFVGRADELAALGRLLEHHENVVVLSGPAGVGKTRLLEEFRARANDIRLFQATCSPYGASSPYSLFRQLLRDGLGIDANADPARAGVVLGRTVETFAPALLPMLPLLAVPYGAAVESTPEADAIDPEYRRAKIHQVVVDFIDALVVDPAVLIAEDVYWIDDASADLLTHLIRAAQTRTWSAVLTRRPEGTWDVPDDIGGVVRLDLAPLTETDIRTLATRSSTRALSDAELDVVVDRSSGNPLYTIELARAMSSGATESLPDSIEGLITSRIDELPPAERTFARVASVFGREFDPADVRVVTDHDAELSALEGLIEPLDGVLYRFQHAMYRDAAYEGLPFRQRRRLHGRVGHYLEERAHDATDIADLLTVHYALAREHEKAWTYGVAAGERAAAQAATEEAASALERALASGRYVPGLGADERARVAMLLGDQLYVVGRFGGAERAYRAARRATGDPLVDATVVLKLAAVFERQGDPQRAIAWYRRAASRVPTGSAGERWLSIRTDATLGEAAIRSRQGQNDRCLDLAQQALEDAQKASNAPLVALALERIHLALVFLRRPATDPGLRATRAYEALDDHTGRSRVLLNRGAAAYFESRWDDASSLYLDAREAALRSGAVVTAATAAMNSAEVLSDQGDWDRALELLQDARRASSAAGYSAGVAVALLYSAVAMMRSGDLSAAATALLEARSELMRLGMSEWIDDVDTRRAELGLLAGDIVFDDDVAVTLDRLIDDAEHPFHARALRLSGVMAAQSGELERAATLLENAMATSSGFERALALSTLAALGRDGAESRQLANEAEKILADLGVTRAPPLALSPID